MQCSVGSGKTYALDEVFRGQSELLLVNSLSQHAGFDRHTCMFIYDDVCLVISTRYSFCVESLPFSLFLYWRDS